MVKGQAFETELRGHCIAHNVTIQISAITPDAAASRSPSDSRRMDAPIAAGGCT